MRNKYNEITYSYSRAKMLDACARSYYYNYYGSAGGWRQDAAQRTKQVYRLKKLQGLNALVGEAIHTSVAQLIVNPEFAKKDFKRLVNKTIRESYRNSLSKRKEWLEDTKLFTMMQEVYYNGEVEPDTQKKIIEKIKSCIEHLDSCETMKEIKESGDIITLDELKEFTYNNCKTYVKIDALYQNKNNDEIVVVDWKTGKGGEVEVEQLLLYVFFVHKMYTIPVELIEARLEYLEDGDSASYRFTEQDMKMAEAIVNKGISRMQNYMFDKDKNIPMPEEYFAKNQSSRCKYCNYRELCYENIMVIPEKESEKVLAMI